MSAVIALAAVAAGLLVPFQYLPWAAGTAKGAILSRLPVMLVIASASLLLLSRCRQCRWEELADDPAFGLQVVYWCVAGIFAVGVSVGSMERVLYYSVGCLPYLVTRSLVNRRDLHRMAKGLAGIGAVLGGLAWAEYLGAWNPWRDVVFSHQNPAYWQLVQHDAFTGRVLGPVGHPVILGAVLAILFPLAVWGILQASGLGSRTAWICATAAIGGGVFVTFSRGAWLALAVGVGTMVVQGGQRRRAVLWCVAVGMAGVVALGFLGPKTAAVLKSRDPVQEYIGHFRDHGRVRAYVRVAEMAALRPLLGLGIGQYRHQVGQVDHVLQTPDNMYLMWLAESGVFGLVAQCLALASIVRCVGNDDRFGLGSAVRAGLLGFMVNLAIADLLYIPIVRLLFWCYAGIGVSAVTHSRRKGEVSG